MAEKEKKTTELPERDDAIEKMQLFAETHLKEVMQRYEKWVTQWPVDCEPHDMSVAEFEHVMGKSDILILTANSVETNTVIRCLSRECESDKNGSKQLHAMTVEGFVVRFGSIGKVKVVCMQQGDTASFTEGGSFKAIQCIEKWFKPKLVVSLGVAFGADPLKYEFGDVLVSDAIVSYDEKNRVESGEFRIDGKAIHFVDSHLIASWRNPLSCRQFPRKAKVGEFCWDCGGMLSGGTLFNDNVAKQKVLEAATKVYTRKIVGGEMEGSGIWCASDKKIPWVVIKGICDWGLQKNSWGDIVQNMGYTNDLVKDCVQAMATENAFLALEYLIKYDSNVFMIDKQDLEKPADKFSLRRLKQGVSRVFKRGYAWALELVFAALFVIAILSCGQLYFNADKGGLTGYTLIGLTLLSVFLIVGALLLQRSYRQKPELYTIHIANLRLMQIDLKRCFCKIKNSDSETLNWVKVTWLSKAQAAPVVIHEHSEFKFNQCLLVDVEKCIIDREFNAPIEHPLSPIIPDVLQIEYTLDGRKICHMFMFAHTKYNPQKYSECIYVWTQGKYAMQYERTHRVRREIAELPQGKFDRL